MHRCVLRSTTLGASLLALSLASPAFGQATDELAQDIEALKKGQQEIRKDLAEIKRLLKARPAAAPSGPNVAGKIFNIGDNPTRGSSSAGLTLIEWTDYQ